MASDGGPLLASEHRGGSNDDTPARRPSWCNSRECWKFTGGASAILGTAYAIGDFANWGKGCAFVPGLGSWITFAKGCDGSPSSPPLPSPSPSTSSSPSPSASPSPSPSALASCNLPGIINPAYAHHPHLGQKVALTDVGITGNGTYRLGPGFTAGCEFPSGFGQNGTAADLTTFIQSSSVNVTGSPFACFADVTQVDNPTCKTSGLVASGGDSELPLIQSNPVIQLFFIEGTATAAEAIKPGSGPYVAALAGAATTLAYDPSLSGVAMVAAQTAGPLASTLSKKAGCSKTTCYHTAAYTAALIQTALLYMVIPDATAMAPIAAQLSKDLLTSRLSTPEAERRAAHLLDRGVLAVTLCSTGAASMPAALFAAGCIWLIRVGREECLNTEAATDSTTAKAPPAPVTPKTPESWSQWLQRKLGCNSRSSAPSHA